MLKMLHSKYKEYIESLKIDFISSKKISDDSGNSVIIISLKSQFLK